MNNFSFIRFRSQQSHLPAEAVLQSDLMRGVADPPVQRLILRVELVAVTQSDTPEVEPCHARHLSVAPYVRTDAEHFPDEYQRRYLRLRPQALRVRYQQCRTNAEVRAHRK